LGKPEQPPIRPSLIVKRGGQFLLSTQHGNNLIDPKAEPNSCREDFARAAAPPKPIETTKANGLSGSWNETNLAVWAGYGMIPVPADPCF
jgi:hypothetical protein